MFEDCSGRKARSVDDAECYIWKFMAENLSTEDRHVKAHSHDYDLYLPWLIEILENQKIERDEAMPIVDMQGLYMDAAWNMVMQGHLRPGPRTVSGDPLRDGYGKGYSLTEKGKQRVVEALNAFTRSA